MQPSIELIDLHKSFGPAKIIQGVNLSIMPGERHAVIGPNGAGKSTLFNLISGRFTPTSGEILLKGQRISGLPPYLINRLGLSRSFQVSSIFPNMSVRENIRCSLLYSMGAGYSGWRSVAQMRRLNERTAEILDSFNLGARSEHQAAVLSYAEQRTLEIAMTVSAGADVILLDEPTAGMSNTETEKAIELIERETRNRTLLIVEHDMGVVFGLADRISVLVYGQVIATGTPAEIRSNDKVRLAYLGEEADHIVERVH